MRIVLVLVSMATAISGCTAFDNGCPDGVWGASDVDGTQRQVDENTFEATGVMLCGHKFSVHDADGLVRLEEIDDARGPLRWGDLRFEVDADGIMMKIGPETSLPMTPHHKERPDRELETTLIIGDEIRFYRSLPSDGHVHVELSQTRYTAYVYDNEGTEASFEPMPMCA